LNDADDDPTCRLAPNKPGPDFEEDLGSVQECQQVLDAIPVDSYDDSAHLLEGPVVHEPDDVSDGRDELGNEERLVRVPEVP